MISSRMYPLSGAVSVLMTSLLVAACSAPSRRHDTESITPAPTPAVTTPLRTIAGSAVGDELTVTAALATVLSGRSFIVRDVDLPEHGLLVLGHLPDGARPADLLTVRGVIDTFDFDRLAWTYRLAHDDRLDTFQGRKILIAQDVRSWA